MCQFPLNFPPLGDRMTGVWCGFGGMVNNTFVVWSFSFSKPSPVLSDVIILASTIPPESGGNSSVASVTC